MISVDVLHSASAVGTQILLTHGDEQLLVDTGDGTVRDLVSRNVDFDKIKGILLTHEHFDHFSGLYGLLHFFRLLRRKQELVLVAPKPVRVVNHMLKPPVMYHQPEYDIRVVELRENESTSIGGIRVEAFPVEHGSANAFGYSIRDDEGFRVVVSGDTQPCASLKQKVKAADVAVLEATYNDEDADLATTYGHMTHSQAKEIGRTAKRVVLVHASPERYFKRFECSMKQSEHV